MKRPADKEGIKEEKLEIQRRKTRCHHGEGKDRLYRAPPTSQPLSSRCLIESSKLFKIPTRFTLIFTEKGTEPQKSLCQEGDAQAEAPMQEDEQKRGPGKGVEGRPGRSNRSGQGSWLCRPKVTQSASDKAGVCAFICLDTKLLCRVREQLCALGNAVWLTSSKVRCSDNLAQRGTRKGIIGLSLLAWGRASLVTIFP